MTVYPILCYKKACYKGTVLYINYIPGLLDLANAYCEPILKKQCEQIIRHGITVQNVAMLYAASIKFEAKVSSLICIFNGESIVLGAIIRIFKECEGWIDKSVPRITVWHHEACRVMTNSDPEGSHPHTNNSTAYLILAFIQCFYWFTLEAPCHAKCI